MKNNVWSIRVLITVFLVMLIVIFYGSTRLKVNNETLAIWSQYPNNQQQIEPKDLVNPTTLAIIKSDTANIGNNNSLLSENIKTFQPKYQRTWVHPTNFGQRFSHDINGIPVSNQPLVVLHETVNSAASAINFFQKPHDDENTQASYHALITLDGTVIYLVPPEFRAFGAGNSVFNGAKGLETVKTHPQFPPSVNNFAYHVALETPPDGRNNAKTHSGYTEAQYHSLAWLIAQSSIPNERITTHRAVDQSGSRIDPRSFNSKKFLNLLQSYRQSHKKG